MGGGREKESGHADCSSGQMWCFIPHTLSNLFRDFTTENIDRVKTKLSCFKSWVQAKFWQFICLRENTK